MIQRIQTFYLVLGAALVAAAPIMGTMWTDSMTDLAWFVPVVSATLALAFLGSVIAIFMYRTRKQQRTVVVLAQLMTLASLVALFLGRRTTESLPGAVGATSADWILFIFPAAAYVLFLLARRAIDKDIRLLKSVDRLR